MHFLRSPAAPLLILGAVALGPRSAPAVDGVVEISQTRAAAGGVSPGDAPGFPVTLSEPGSYVLTSNLDVRSFPGAADLTAVDITADDVTLDLNGFRIVGPASCTGAPGAISCTPGAGVGIRSVGRNTSVTRGSVSGFAGGGATLGPEARVRDLRAADNGTVGISAGQLSVVEQAVALGNGGAGIALGPDGAVLGSNASFNDDAGLTLGAGTGFSSSVLNQNGAGSAIGGVALGSNVCDGTATCNVVCTDADGDGYASNCAPVDCSDANPVVFPGALETCDGIDNDCDLAVDEGCADGIAAARAATGVVSIPIANVLVTYVRPAVGSDPPGFFLQAAPTGPALFVAVDPATLSPSPAVGDRLSLVVGEMALIGGLPQAIAVSGIVVSASGQAVTGLTQNVSAATDLVSAIGSYDSELISLAGTLTGAFSAAGQGHVSAPLATAGVSGGALALRLPTTLQSLFGGGAGCAIQLSNTPLLRFDPTVQPHAWNASELAGTLCPDVTVNQATASSPTTVIVSFERDLDPASVLPDASQFTFSGGLAAVAAVANGNAVTVTTSSQSPGASYSVSVASSVTDVWGAAVSAAANQAAFAGWITPAVVRINELNATLANGCDLVELRVIAGGSLDGFQLLERDAVLVTFSNLVVATNDFVIVHLNGASSTCNPLTSGNESASPTQQPTSAFAANFDGAYDWHSPDTGLTATTNVLTLRDGLGAIVDAVLVADGLTGTVAAASEAQAAVVAAAGEWEQLGGGVPPGGFVADVFRANAVLDSDATGTTRAGTSIQRADNGDTNTAADWSGAGAGTWAILNPGQSLF